MAYPNSGKLSENRYKNGDPKKPDVIGELVMTRQALKQLMEEHNDDDIVIKLSGWYRQGQYGNFTSISWNSYKKREEPKPEQPAPPAQESFDDAPF